MTLIDRIMASPAWWRAGWTMVHYLWLGAALGGMAWGTRMMLGRADARVRYAVAMLWLMALAVTPVGIAVRLASNDVRTDELSVSIAKVSAQKPVAGAQGVPGPP